MIEIEKVSIMLGEKEYIVTQASFMRAKPWKKRLFEEIKPLFERLGGASEMTFASPADLFALLPLAEQLFIGGIDIIFDLLVTYSPVLEAERAYIEAHATDKQIMGAFQEVVKLSDPFGIVQQLNRRLGLRTNGISSSLPVASGA